MIWNKLRNILEYPEDIIDDNEEMYAEIFNYSFAEIFNFSEKWEFFLKNEFNDDFNCIINYKEYFENFFYGALHFDDLENGLYRLNKDLEKNLKDNTSKD